MSINISDLIKVSISVAPNAIATDGFGPILFMSKEYSTTVGEKYPVRSYSSLKEVLEDFPSGEISKAATAWYSQKPTPKTFLVGSIEHEGLINASPGTLTAKTSPVLSSIKALENGTLTITVNGDIKTTAEINFSSVDSIDDAIVLLNNEFAVSEISLVASNYAGRLSLSTLKVGKGRYVDDATGSIAQVFKISSTDTPTASVGSDEMSISADLAKISNTPFDFFYVGLDRKYRNNQSPVDNQMAVAKWCEASGKVFGWGDSDSEILVTGTKNSFRRAKNAGLRNTICVYDASENKDEYPEISILGRAATVNFNVANSSLILAFKQGPGVTVADLSSGQLTALQMVNGNAFINVDDNNMFWNGKMADGTWFDTVQGVEWLTKKIRNNIFNLFYQSATKIPWSETGVALVNQQITLALELARTNGLIAPGYDSEGKFYSDGYKVYSTDMSLAQGQKGSRIWEGSSFIAIGAGALQGAIISGNFVQ